ncbi:MAG TPA: AMP-binding protein [Verrucomicrobia bacterium]|nr:AMP-binding protein [Verrucomicrobiota bacterium]HOB31629.1 AMP-binding protein [Verrucomicrobiota bacterium]HOP98728.1 AMP-binding protein [Verrucomicrobiota bacterium]
MNVPHSPAPADQAVSLSSASGGGKGGAEAAPFDAFRRSQTRNAQSVPARFAEIVSQHPRRIAISTPQIHWSYEELAARIEGIALRILATDTTAPVALLMSHDAPLIASILAVLHTGRIYCVLDPLDPPAVLRAVLSDCGANLLLADTDHESLAVAIASDTARVLNISRLAPAAGGECRNVSPEAGAWLMYTSGSTGTPKGVWQTHAAVVHQARVYAGLIGISPEDRLSLLTPCNLAASVTAIFGALLHGATLCPFPLRSQGVGRLAEWISQRQITVYHSVPTVFRHLARERALDPRRVRLVRLGGEAVRRDDVDLFRGAFPKSCRLLHAFSSTETGLVTAMLIDQATGFTGAGMPAGYAVPGVEVMMVNEQRELLPAGVEGRIAVRSAHLAQGYWNQPDLSRATFIPDPTDPARRLFLSQDLGVLAADGCLEHRGRIGSQVKINGRRVDLMEIEDAVRRLSEIKDVVVAAPETGGADERKLVAHVVPRSPMDAATLRKRLRDRLPSHEIPAEFVFIERLPQTTGGKVDRRKLSVPAPRPSSGRSAPPRDGIEGRLAAIWKSVLNRNDIGRFDDFFDLGGNSLLAAQVLARVEEFFNVALPPSVLIERSTIVSLAVLLAQETLRSDRPLVVLRKEGCGRPLFFIHNGKGTLSTYGQLARRLPGRPVYGLQSAGLLGERWPIMRIPDMLRRYLPEVLEADPTGPYLLAATCMGGMVAFEMAQQLARMGRSVALLALMDAPTPPFSGRRPRIDHILGDPIRDRLRIWRWWLVRWRHRGIPAALLPAYRHFVAGMNARAWRRYRPKSYPGTITLVLTEAPRKGEDRRLLISRHARETRTIHIPGDRSGLFMPPALDELARQLQRVIEEAERTEHPTSNIQH